MLSHVPRSRFIDPGRPPAADGGLRSQYLDLVLGARQPLDCRQLRQAGPSGIDPLLRHEVEDVHRLGSLGYQTGPSEPQLTTSAQRTGYVHEVVIAQTHRVWRVGE